MSGRLTSPLAADRRALAGSDRVRRAADRRRSDLADGDERRFAGEIVGEARRAALAAARQAGRPVPPPVAGEPAEVAR